MYLLTLSFCGRNYCGWQAQQNGQTVQNVLKDAVSKIFKLEAPYPSGCSRTDSGVHALEFLATVPELRNIPPDSFKKGLNSFLPKDIRVVKVERVEGNRDGREFVFGKHYRYLICLKPEVSPFAADFSWHSKYNLDAEKMARALTCFVGSHDFAAFASSGSDVKTTARTIYKARLLKNGGYLALDFLGDGFLKHQIRIIAGTLAAVGRGRVLPEEIPLLIAAKNRDLVPYALPGAGLFLYRVFRNAEEISSYRFPDSFEEMIW